MRPELIQVLSQTFRLSPEMVTEDSSPDTISAWDSLGHLQLISSLEASFGLRFNIREIQTMDSVSKIEAVLCARGK